MKKSILLFVVLLAFVSNAFSQVASAPALATATVVTPLTITKDVDLDFGSLAATGGGSLTINAGTGALTPSAGVAVIGGTSTRAQFTANGQLSESIVITFPITITLTSVALDIMTVTGITSNLGATGATTTLDAATGDAVILIGGQLNVNNNQPAGVYTNASDLIVTVNYN